MKKRGQAAMEFLMTYGWALLIVLVAIGALAYLGVLNPARFVPPKCDLSPGIACTTFKADFSGDAFGSTGEYIAVRMQNGLGETLSSVTLTLSSTTAGGSPYTACDTVNTGSAVASWTDGTTQDFTFDCGGNPPGWAVGDKLKSTLTLTYTASGIARTKTGQLVADVEA